MKNLKNIGVLMSKKDFIKKCKVCLYTNEEDALYCAECGRSVIDNSISKFSKFILFSIFILNLSIYNKIEEDKLKIKRQEQKRQEQQEKREKKRRELAIPLKEILIPIINLKKDIFETTQEFQVKKNNLLNNKLEARAVGKLIMQKYDADSEVLTYTIDYDKGFKEFLNINSKSSMRIHLKREVAKSIFAKKQTVEVFAKLSSIGDEINISHLYISYQNKHIYLIDVTTIYIGSIEVQNISSKVKDLKLSFMEAKKYCETSLYNDSNNWRLPNLEELKLINKNKNMLKYYEAGSYWTETTYTYNTQYAWVVNFHSNNSYDSIKSYKNRVRCVKDIQ